jgi:hypothetical protein
VRRRRRIALREHIVSAPARRSVAAKPTRLHRIGRTEQALGWGPASNREVEAAMVVFVLPLAELLGERGGVPEDHAPVEFVFVRPMAAGAFARGLEVAAGTGDLQTTKEIEGFLRRLEERRGTC